MSVSKWSRLASLAVLTSAAAASAMPGSGMPIVTKPAVVPAGVASIASPATRPTVVVVPVKAGGAVVPVVKTLSLPFEKEIVAYEAADKSAKPAEGGILFYGSSSIRLWKTLKDDFAGLSVLNRGFGGSTAPDALKYAERMVLPYKPSTVIFYEGDNDLGKGRTPEQLLADYQAFAKLVHSKLPNTKIVYLSVKPSPKRADLITTQQKANAMLETWIAQSKDSRLSFIDTFRPMLDGKGQVRAELFGPDKLHMNREGYKLWSSLLGLKPALNQVAGKVEEAAGKVEQAAAKVLASDEKRSAAGATR
jgi:lysophospholipase L1-like esterase